MIDPYELVKKYGTDAVRYYLLREFPPTEDGDFTEERFKERYQKDLSEGLGNLVARVLGMLEKYSQGKIPRIKKDPDTHPLRIDEKLYTWKKSWKKLDEYFLNFEFNKALSSIWRFIKEADKYIERNKPWELFKKGDKENLNWVLYGLADSLHQLSWQIYPFLPETSLKIAKALKIKKLLTKNPNYKDTWCNIEFGKKIEKIPHLFPKIA